MGTSGTALFSDDTACDVRDQFIELLAEGAAPAEATETLIGSRQDEIEDVDDGPVIWLALAATQWKHGCLDETVKARAIAAIDDGTDLARWTGAAAARRQNILSTLRATLMSPQPAARQPRRRKLPEIRSTQVLSPDGLALAKAYELGKPTQFDPTRMQVAISCLDTRSGGGVFTADCAYTDIVLTWLDSDTLEIAYPQSTTETTLSHVPRDTFYNSGRTIRLVRRIIAA